MTQSQKKRKAEESDVRIFRSLLEFRPDLTNFRMTLEQNGRKTSLGSSKGAGSTPGPDLDLDLDQTAAARGNVIF